MCQIVAMTATIRDRPMLPPSTKFHETQPGHFSVILLTDKQTNQPTNQKTNKQTNSNVNIIFLAEVNIANVVRGWRALSVVSLLYC